MHVDNVSFLSEGLIQRIGDEQDVVRILFRESPLERLSVPNHRHRADWRMWKPPRRFPISMLRGTCRAVTRHRSNCYAGLLCTEGVTLALVRRKISRAVHAFAHAALRRKRMPTLAKFRHSPVDRAWTMHPSGIRPRSR